MSKGRPGRQKELYAKRKKNSLCALCAAPVGINPLTGKPFHRCPKCAEKKKTSNNASRKRRLEQAKKGIK